MTLAVTELVITYAGDATAQTLQVRNPDTGVPVDISAASEITFAARRSLADSVIITKLKSTGGIVFTTDGTDGKFNVVFAAADTLALLGYYLFQSVYSIGAVVTTGVIGRMQIGQSPAWTYSGDPDSSLKDSVRFLVGDTLYTDQQIFDPEVLYAIKTRGNIWGAAATCCMMLSTQMSRKADTKQGDLYILYSSRAKQYAMRAAYYENKAIALGGGLPYAGGISVADKINEVANNDRVNPAFNIGMTDNWIPIGPAGNETSTGASGYQPSNL